jgi:4'-phosphopantetheinyl transferase
MHASGLNTLSNTWEHPSPEITLQPGEVHLWRVQFDLLPPVLDQLISVLSNEEREKAARFYFQADRERYITSKACQRTVLGAYLGVEPGSLVFDLNPHGKPRLSGEIGATALAFNLSHTLGLGILAVARGVELGVDVENAKAREVDMGIARRFFSPHEVAVLEALPVADQMGAFFVCWTRKEAYIKARGEGLAFPLDKFSVSFSPNQLPALLSNEEDPDETRRWAFYHLDLGPGYAGALAIPARHWTFRQFKWVVDQGSASGGF